MTAIVFVDTNVFIYARHTDEALKQSMAQQWLERVWSQQTGRTSVQVLNECYYTLMRKTKPGLPSDDAWDYVRELFAWNPQPIDTDVVLRAREIERRYHLSWWDSLIVGAAQAQNCILLLTEDLQDRAVYGGVTVRNPFTLGVSEAEAEYAAAPVAARRYRPRGRPTRTKRIAAATL
jgi:predicted nucleic acid-binding protein